MQELLRIGDFSQLAQVTVPTLRHYNELGLLEPARVDPFTEYRYYSLDQLPRLHRILALKDLGFALDQIKILLSDELPPERLRLFLETRRTEIAQQVQSEQARLARVEARLQQIEGASAARSFEVALKSIPAQTVLAYRHEVATLADMPESRHRAFKQLYALLSKIGLRDPGPEIVYYDNDGWTDEHINMHVGVSISPKQGKALDALIVATAGLQITHLPTEPAATITHHGPWWDIPESISALFRWIAGNGYVSTGPIRESHLTWRELDAYATDEIVFEVQLPVDRTV